MAMKKSTLAGEFFQGWWEADKKDTAEKLLVRSKELENIQGSILDMKKKDYDYEMDNWKEKNKVVTALNSVKTNFDNNKYANNYQLGEAILRARHGDKYDAFKASHLGTEGDTRAWQSLVNQEGKTFNIDTEEVFTDYKEKSVIQAEYVKAVKDINEETKKLLLEYKDDSATVNAILGWRDKKIKEVSPDSNNVAVIDKANTIKKDTNWINKKDKEKLDEIETTISTETGVDTSAMGEVEENKEEAAASVSSLDDKYYSWVSPKFKTEAETQLKDAKKVNYASEEMNKKIADSVLTLIPNGQRKDFFTEGKDGKFIANESIINADKTYLSLMTNSIKDLDTNTLWAITNEDKGKISNYTNTNDRFRLVENHVIQYGEWYSGGKFFSAGGINASNLLKKQTNALIVPSNSVIGVNNNELKGYNVIIDQKKLTLVDENEQTYQMDSRKYVGQVYSKWLVAKAKERTNDKNIGGTLESNINYLQSQLQNDSEGNSALVKEARSVIANALGVETKKETDGQTNISSINQVKKELGMADTQELKIDAVLVPVKTLPNGTVEKDLIALTDSNKEKLTAMGFDYEKADKVDFVNKSVEMDSGTGASEIAEEIVAERVSSDDGSDYEEGQEFLDETAVVRLTEDAEAGTISDEDLLALGDMVKHSDIPRNVRYRLLQLKWKRNKEENLKKQKERIKKQNEKKEKRKDNIDFSADE